MIDPVELGRRLAELRSELDLTDGEIVANTGNLLTHGYISKLERGVTANPGVFNLVLIAEGMGISFRALLDRLGFSLGAGGIEAQVPKLVIAAPGSETWDQAQNMAFGFYAPVRIIDPRALARHRAKILTATDIMGYALIPGIKTAAAAAQCFCVEAWDDAMSPFMRHGSLLCVEALPADALLLINTAVEAKEVLIVRQDGDLKVGFLDCIDATSSTRRIVLRPRNPQYPVSILSWADPADYPVLGRIVCASIRWGCE
jgi:transcriptional regulator with XRE-family HTH domain